MKKSNDKKRGWHWTQLPESRQRVIKAKIALSRTKRESPNVRKAVQRPTTLDIAWAAAIIEGEGSIRTFDRRTATIEVCQKEPWLTTRMQELFGGSIRKRSIPAGDYWCWIINGGRARGFMMTIYKFLSPHKQAQAKLVLTAGKEIFRGYRELIEAGKCGC